MNCVIGMLSSVIRELSSATLVISSVMRAMNSVISELSSDIRVLHSAMSAMNSVNTLTTLK